MGVRPTVPRSGPQRHLTESRPAADPDDALEFVDLGERPLRGGLQVDPVSVANPPAGPRRAEPRLVLLAAVGLVALAALGGGPLAPEPPSSASPGPSAMSEPSAPVAIASASPSPAADPCPPAGLRAPSAVLSPTNRAGISSGPAPFVRDVADAGFVPPVDQALEVGAGFRMRVELTDARCVEAIAIALSGTGVPGGQALTVSTVTQNAGRRHAFNAPPAGDWVLRIAVRLRGSRFEDAPWAIYFFRLNVGYVAYESPIPEIPPGPSVEPLVTPAIACVALDTGAPLPPAVDLVRGDGSRTPGVLREYRWQGAAGSGTGSPDPSTLDAVVLEFGEPITIRLADDACAVRWRIEARRVPDTGQPLEVIGVWEESPENASGNPAVAAQNVFAVGAVAVGSIVIHATFDFQTGDREVVYWRAEVAGLPIPAIRVAADPGGQPVAPVAGCGAWYQFASGASGGDECGPSWPELPDGPFLMLAEGGLLRADAPGWTVTGWSARYAPQSDVVPSGNNPGTTELVSGWSEVGFASVQIPAPPPGEWSVQVFLTLRRDGDTISSPYYVRLQVTG